MHRTDNTVASSCYYSIMKPAIRSPFNEVLTQADLLLEICEKVHKKCMLPIKLMVICQLDSLLCMLRVVIFQEYVTET